MLSYLCSWGHGWNVDIDLGLVSWYWVHWLFVVYLMILLCFIWSWHGLIGYRCLWILRDSRDVDFSWIREVFGGTINGFSKNYEGHSPDMDLRWDSSYMSLGWILGYLNDNLHSHSPLLVYSTIYYLRGITHYFSQVHCVYSRLSWYGSWAMVHELVLEGSLERWLRIGYLHVHMLFLCWLSFGDGFILGIFPGLGMVIP